MSATCLLFFKAYPHDPCRSVGRTCNRTVELVSDILIVMWGCCQSQGILKLLRPLKMSQTSRARSTTSTNKTALTARPSRLAWGDRCAVMVAIYSNQYKWRSWTSLHQSASCLLFVMTRKSEPTATRNRISNPGNPLNTQYWTMRLLPKRRTVSAKVKLNGADRNPQPK